MAFRLDASAQAQFTSATQGVVHKSQLSKQVVQPSKSDSTRANYSTGTYRVSLFVICVVDDLPLCLGKQFGYIGVLRVRHFLGGINFGKGQSMLVTILLPHRIQQLLASNSSGDLRFQIRKIFIDRNVCVGTILIDQRYGKKTEN